MKRYACIFLLFHFLFVNGDDLQTMLNLLKSLPPSSNGKSWNTTNKNPCLWSGVSCNSTHVTGLSLLGLGLTTSSTNSSASLAFFKLVCELQSLVSLDLSLNSLAFVPSSFFSNCSGLTSLNLSSNGLNVPLVEFSGLSKLESLDLSSNLLQGEVGGQWDGLRNLKILKLSHNSIEGKVPLILGFKKLVLSDNQLNGTIPNEVSQLKNLTLLDLSMNSLSGSIPDGISQLKSLSFLDLSMNRLNGSIPSNLSSIQSLNWFAANQNELTGSIPSGITRNLQFLDLSYNQLSGQIPSDLLSPSILKYVDLSSNMLQGPIPLNLSQSLFRFRLGGNNLNGTVPSSFQRLQNLTYLELNNNGLEGEIPVQLAMCRNLTLLNLAGNRLRGKLPNELGNLTKLVIIQLQYNYLSGEIPNGFSNMVKLIKLNLGQNSFIGSIPSSITNLLSLQNLNLASNRLDGSIPSNMSVLNRLIELQLGNNQLSGTIPRMPATLSLALNLSNNHFNGSIPSYLGDLTLLQILDLSDNNFTGEIPSSLTQMQSLTLLVLSNNNLSGTLPIFPKHVEVLSTGNTGLSISTSGTEASSRRKFSYTLVIIVSIFGAMIGIGLVTAVVFLVISKRSDRVEDIGLQLEENPPQVVSGCYITSDSIHRSNIDFAKAMEVVGNPSNIMLKTKFSTYYKAVMPSGSSYTVKKLNWSEKIFQMGSNERFGQELQVVGRLSNSNLMVPLAYVLTRDDAYLFYDHVHKGTLYDFLHKGSESAMDWQSRYSIALGVAQGLTFLHGCTQPVLLLDLSTKSIHLKSMKEPQIGDIELCKVIDPSKSTGSISAVAGSVGYIPPEYAYTMRVTAAGNVYSLGVILLELLTGKPPVSEGVELAKLALGFSSRLSQGEQILDARVCNASPAVLRQMLAVLKVAINCVSLSPEARPKMRNVLRGLFNAR